MSNCGPSINWVFVPDLAKPATYIVDKQGQVRFAYVGANIADRPSVHFMLDQLAAINAASTSAS